MNKKLVYSVSILILLTLTILTGNHYYKQHFYGNPNIKEQVKIEIKNYLENEKNRNVVSIEGFYQKGKYGAYVVFSDSRKYKIRYIKKNNGEIVESGYKENID